MVFQSIISTCILGVQLVIFKRSKTSRKYMGTTRYSEGSLFRKFEYSEGSFFRKFVIPEFRYSEGLLFRKVRYSKGSLIVSPKMK